MMESHWNSEEIVERLAQVRERLGRAAAASGRTPADIRLMAVTKTVPAEFINLVFDQGVTLFGENRAQELCEKYVSYRFDSPNVHFIGALQRNKVRQIVDKVSCIQSVDSLPLAQEISKQADRLGKRMDILLEVNIGSEESKAGITPNQLPYLVEQTAALSGIFVRGLMTIPPIAEKSDQNRRYFDQMYKLFVDIKYKKIDNVSMEYLSMGMSGDYETAIEAGANLIRVGSGIFGKRSYPNM